nr:SubclassB3_beta_lactamase [uncultured bacterium]
MHTRNHLPNPTRALALATFLLVLAALASGQNGAPVSSCANCPEWNKPQKPFRVYGNTYYVGPHGLSSILITSRAGHILIDGALPESVPQVVANIRSLGFRVEDVKLVVNSHVHFDHGGGIAELQRLSGAEVAASPWSAEVLTKSGVGKGDPQFGSIPPVALVPRATTLGPSPPQAFGGVARKLVRPNPCRRSARQRGRA